MESILEISVNHENEKFLSSFTEYRMTPFSFFMLFFAILFERSTTHLKRDFADEFYELKKNEKYSKLLECIKFKSNGIHIYSNQIDESINLLQTSDLLGKKNPSFGDILIEYDDNSVSEVKSKFDSGDISLMEDLVDEFLTIIKDR